jgi:hypothetical protein
MGAGDVSMIGPEVLSVLRGDDADPSYDPDAPGVPAEPDGSDGPDGLR